MVLSHFLSYSQKVYIHVKGIWKIQNFFKVLENTFWLIHRVITSFLLTQTSRLRTLFVKSTENVLETFEKIFQLRTWGCVRISQPDLKFIFSVSRLFSLFQTFSMYGKGLISLYICVNKKPFLHDSPIKSYLKKSVNPKNDFFHKRWDFELFLEN